MYRRARSSVVFVERAPFSVVICAESFRVSECGRRSFLYLPERHTADLLLCTAGCVTLAVFDALELGKPPIATPSASARFSKSGRYSSGRLFRRRATWKTNYQWEWRRDIGRGESKASRTRGNPSRRTPEGVRGALGAGRLEANGRAGDCRLLHALLLLTSVRSGLNLRTGRRTAPEWDEPVTMT
jgi:hypothetical protein